MARVSSFSSFIRQSFPTCLFNPYKKDRCYRATSTTASSTSTSTASSLCNINNRTHNHNINLVVQSLSRRCQSRRQLFQLQAHFICSGLFRNVFPVSHILKLSSAFAHIEHTILIFQLIRSPDTFCINTVLKAYSSHPHLAPLFYFRMLDSGFRPNSFTFPPLLTSCGNSLCTQAGLICHAHSIKYGVNNVLPVQNSLIHMYASLGHIHSASLLFNAMSERDIVSWNTIIHGYVKQGDLKIAHSIFDNMPTKNVISWNIMISGYLNDARNPGCGLKLFREMMKMGFRGTDTTFVAVLTACGRSARLKEGRSIHGSLIKNSIKSTLFLDTTLIDMYSKCQNVQAARSVFDSMLVRNLVSWNAMILGYCIHGCPEDGITLFREMIGSRDSSDDVDNISERDNGDIRCGNSLEKHFLPDEVTFIGVLCACARKGLLSDGRDYFNQMLAVYNIKPKFAHYWCMANLYNGVGLVQEAEEILRSIPEDENCSSESLVWSSLLGSCRFRGDIELGERIAMRLIELDPQNGSHYSLLWNIYAVAGRWEDVAKLKTMMDENQVAKPCGSRLVDLNELVHEYAVGHGLRPGTYEIYPMLDELVQKLKLLTGKFREHSKKWEA
ncbi:hypothetical protein ACHQM5_010531 [Ranunculus cassubicifolius]